MPFLLGGARVSLQFASPRLALWRQDVARFRQVTRIPIVVKSKPAHTTISMANQSTVVNHVVLVHLKDDIPVDTKNALVSGLLGLRSLQQVITLQIGDVSTLVGEKFNFALNSRYGDRVALQEYADHPSHMEVVKSTLLPNIDDLHVVDWEFQTSKSLAGEKYGAAIFGFLKLKLDITDEEQASVIESIDGLQGKFPDLIKEVTVGKSITPGRAKGYHVGFSITFSSSHELATLGFSPEHSSLAPLAPLIESWNIVTLEKVTECTPVKL